MKRVFELTACAILIPVAILGGIHVFYLAIAVRRFLRIPYIVGAVAMLAGELAAFGVFATFPTLGIAVIAIAITICFTFDSREDWFEGGNFEHFMPAHMIGVCVILFSLAWPGLQEEIQRRRQACWPATPFNVSPSFRPQPTPSRKHDDAGRAIERYLAADSSFFCATAASPSVLVGVSASASSFAWANFAAAESGYFLITS